MLLNNRNESYSNRNQYLKKEINKTNDAKLWDKSVMLANIEASKSKVLSSEEIEKRTKVLKIQNAIYKAFSKSSNPQNLPVNEEGYYKGNRSITVSGKEFCEEILPKLMIEQEQKKYESLEEFQRDFDEWQEHYLSVQSREIMTANMGNIDKEKDANKLWLRIDSFPFPIQVESVAEPFCDMDSKRNIFHKIYVHFKVEVHDKSGDILIKVLSETKEENGKSNVYKIVKSFKESNSIADEVKEFFEGSNWFVFLKAQSTKTLK